MCKLISIILPAYNEAKILERNAVFLRGFMKKYYQEFEIIIGNDGSRDSTFEVARRLSSEYPEIKAIGYKMNRGRGNILKYASRFVKGNKVMFIDVDLPTALDIEKLKIMLDSLEKYDISVASRYLPASNIRRKPIRAFLSAGYKVLVRIAFPYLRMSDSQCGCKAFRRNVFAELNKRIKNKRWSWDLEMFINAHKLGYNVKEIPITWKEEGKSSINIMFDPIEQIVDLIKLRLKY